MREKIKKIIIMTLCSISFFLNVKITYADEINNKNTQSTSSIINENSQTKNKYDVENQDKKTIPKIDQGNKSNLGYASDQFTFFIFNDLDMIYGDAHGRVAVGNSFSWTDFSVIKDLIVGNEIKKFEHGQVQGATVLGTNGKNTANAQDVLYGDPINFEKAYEDLRLKSSLWGNIQNTGEVKCSYDTETIELNGGTSDDFNAFNITAEQFNKCRFVNITAKEGSTILINVSGDNIKFHQESPSLNGTSLGESHEYNNILWNFPDAKNITAGVIAGSALAPDATVTAENGHIDGCLVVKNLFSKGSWEGHFYPFSGVIDNEKIPNVQLPNAGGHGVKLYSFIGLFLISISLIIKSKTTKKFINDK